MIFSLDPVTAVLTVFPGRAIEAAEEGAPDAPAYAMEESGLLVADQLVAWIGHAHMLAQPLLSENQ